MSHFKPPGPTARAVESLRALPVHFEHCRRRSEADLMGDSAWLVAFEGLEAFVHDENDSGVLILVWYVVNPSSSGAYNNREQPELAQYVASVDEPFVVNGC